MPLLMLLFSISISLKNCMQMTFCADFVFSLLSRFKNLYFMQVWTALTALKNHLECSMLSRLEKQATELFNLKSLAQGRVKWLKALRSWAYQYEKVEKVAVQLNLQEQNIARQQAAIHAELRRVQFVSADFQNSYVDFDQSGTEPTWEWVSSILLICHLSFFCI